MVGLPGLRRNEAAESCGAQEPQRSHLVLASSRYGLCVWKRGGSPGEVRPGEVYLEPGGAGDLGPRSARAQLMFDGLGAKLKSAAPPADVASTVSGMLEELREDIAEE